MDTDRDRRPGGPAVAGYRGPGPVRLGPYELLEKLGQGGVGTVYRARHVHLKRPVALKVLAPGRVPDARAIARFFQEMEAAGKFDHPNLIRATDGGECDRRLFLVMDLVDGQDLARLVRDLGTLAIPDACELVRQAAEGLQCVSEHGLVHRDVKPSNLMLRADGMVKILDLGLARMAEGFPGGDALTRTGEVVGTVDYMAPEQGGAGRRVDIRADLYSLGCTLYKLLAGRAPFVGPQYDTNLKTMMAHALVPAPPIRLLRAEVPEELEALLVRLLAKNPDDRPSTPAEVAAALAPWAVGADLRGLAARQRTEVSMTTLAPDPSAPTSREPSGLSPTDSFSGTVREENRPAPAQRGVSLPRAVADFPPWRFQASEDLDDSANVLTSRLPELKPEAPSGVFTSWSWHRRGNDCPRRWVQDLALVVTLVVMLALVGLASALSKAPTTTSKLLPVPQSQVPTPQPTPTAPQPQAVEGVAFDPLLAAPTVLLWPGPPSRSQWRHDASKRTLFLSTDDSSLLALGKAPAGGRYTFEIGLEQFPWVGGVGLFFGARHTQVHGKPALRYQTAELASFRDQNDQDVFVIRRRVVNLTELGIPEIQILQSVAIPRPVAASNHRLGIAVGPEGLEQVLWDGKTLPELVADVVNDGLEADDFHDSFGLVNLQGTSLIHHASYLFQKGAKHVEP